MPEIKESNSRNIPGIAECQLQCFPASMAVLLGKKTVEKSLEWFLISDNRFLIHIEEDEKVVGFLGGFAPRFIGDGGKSGMFMHSLPETIKAFVKNPSLVMHNEIRNYAPAFVRNIAIRFLNNLSLKPPIQNSTDYLQCLQVSIIGVHPSFRGNGYALALMKKAEDYAALHNKQKLQLSVKQKNLPAVNMYKKAEWEISGRLKDTFQMKKQLGGIRNQNLVVEA
ncbi:MAG: family N-acetyltransferase [Segetibacter sp.]|jgi:GNAT superfamily N-acetyltransferase|nr:family N-acetyltransferase [Segetibacter sp.]